MSPHNKIRTNFIQSASTEVMAMASRSDLFDVSVSRRSSSAVFGLFFHTRCFLRGPKGQVVEHEGVLAEIKFPDDYVSRASSQPFIAPEIVGIVMPPNIWHPQVKYPYICIGDVAPRTPISQLVFQLYEVLRYKKIAPHSPLNEEAAVWARRNMHLFPVDTRPLLSRKA